MLLEKKRIKFENMLVVFDVALSLTDAVRHQFSYSHKNTKGIEKKLR